MIAFDSNFFFILIPILNVLVIFFPNFFFKREEIVRGRHLKELHPKLAWLTWGFPLAYFSFFAMFFLLPFLLKMVYLPWFMNLFAVNAAFFGFFSIFAKVLILPARGPRLHCVFGRKATMISVIQLFSSFVIILINTAILFFLIR